MRCTIFAPSTGVFLPVYDDHLFDESVDFTVNPKALTVFIIAITHACKTVLNPGTGTWLKGRDGLPAWLTAFISNLDVIEETNASVLTLNWND